MYFYEVVYATYSQVKSNPPNSHDPDSGIVQPKLPESCPLIVQSISNFKQRSVPGKWKGSKRNSSSYCLIEFATSRCHSSSIG